MDWKEEEQVSDHSESENEESDENSGNDNDSDNEPTESERVIDRICIISMNLYLI